MITDVNFSLNGLRTFFSTEELNLHNDSSERERKKVVAMKQVCFMNNFSREFP